MKRAKIAVEVVVVLELMNMMLNVCSEDADGKPLNTNME